MWQVVSRDEKYSGRNNLTTKWQYNLKRWQNGSGQVLTAIATVFRKIFECKLSCKTLGKWSVHSTKYLLIIFLFQLKLYIFQLVTLMAVQEDRVRLFYLRQKYLALPRCYHRNTGWTVLHYPELLCCSFWLDYPMYDAKLHILHSSVCDASLQTSCISVMKVITFWEWFMGYLMVLIKCRVT
jgi:hypothetical protein